MKARVFLALAVVAFHWAVTFTSPRPLDNAVPVFHKVDVPAFVVD